MRDGHKDYLKFLNIALGSACEVKYLASLTSELGYGHGAGWTSIIAQSDAVVRQLQRLVQQMEQSIQNSKRKTAAADRGPRTEDRGLRTED